jgi:integrase
MTTITKRIVDALAPGAVVWERGFGVKANADGTKSYVLDYRTGRRKRRYTIGTHGAPWTLAAARKRARELLVDVTNGIDPLERRSAGRTAPTVREVAERFLDEHVQAKRKVATYIEYKRLVESHILPALGPRAIAEVTRADVAKLHHRLKGTPMQANRVLAVVSKLSNWAEQRGLRREGSNPARLLERYKERRRERYLSGDELRRLGAALTAAETGALIVDGEPEPARLSLFAVAAIRLLLFTGARRNEILGLRWSEVDVEHACLRLRESKTGQKTVQLNRAALAVLESLPRIGDNPHVIVGQRAGAHLVNLTDSWHVIRQAAGLKDVRLHDLRHAFASVAASEGIGLHTIGGLLGHTQPTTTQRYAHLSADPLKRAAELVGAKIAAAMGGGA